MYAEVLHKIKQLKTSVDGEFEFHTVRITTTTVIKKLKVVICKLCKPRNAIELDPAISSIETH